MGRGYNKYINTNTCAYRHFHIILLLKRLNMVEFALFLLCMSGFMIAQGQKKYPLGVVDYELDREFDLMDENKDNVVDQQEFDTSTELADADRNGCVSMKEYFDYHHGNLMTFEWHMFQHFDHNQDGCIELEDMKEEFHEIDINPKDGRIEVRELEVYYEKLYEQIGVVSNP